MTTLAGVGIIGRGSEREAIEARFDEGHRIVTLVGTAGVGKTALARSVEVSAVCDFAEARGSVDGTLLEALGAPATARGLASLEPWLRRQRRVLLDNVDEVVEELAPRIAEWSSWTPLLVTSRQPLHTSGEVLVPIGPLSMPSRWASESDSNDASAVRMLVEVARARGVRADSLDWRSLAEIARRVDGLPLALELVASRMRTLGCRALLELLDQPLELSSARRDAPSHHSSLTRAIDCSWVPLDEPARRGLVRLALLVGSFGLSEARSVLGEDAVEILETLCERSLLEPLGDRWRMLAPIASFARARTAEGSYVDARLFDRRAERLFERGRHPECLAALDRAEALLSQDADGLVQADIDEHRASALRRMGRFAEARRLGARALAHATDPRARARARGALAVVAVDEGDLEAARAELLQIPSNELEGVERILVVGMLGHIEQEEGNLEASFADLGDHRLSAVYAGYAATVAHERGDPDADARYRGAIEALEDCGPHFAGLFAACLGSLRASLGDEAGAGLAFDRADRVLVDCHEPALLRAVALHRAWSGREPVLEPGPTSDDVRFAQRLRRRRHGEVALVAGDRQVRLGGIQVDLRRRRVLWRILEAMVDHGVRAPGEVVTREALIAAGWPGERVLPKAAAHRLRVAIYDLRKTGLGEVLVGRDGGYALTCPVRRDRPEGATFPRREVD